jgi:tungstate transport system ATP-binding protein
VAGANIEIADRRPEAPEDILPLTVEGLTFEAGGKQILSRLTFCLEGESPSFIIGPNGAGKSVLLRLCHGLLQPTAGKVIWAATAAAKPSSQQAMVFQRPVLLRRSVRANIEYALFVRKIRRPERQRHVTRALEETGLANLAEQPARVLSIGEQQRLALARVWALHPRVLFLDEPTAHLDPSSTRVVEDIITRIFESGTKIIMTSHDMGQVQRLADEVLFLHGGHLIEQTSVDQFFSQPRTREGKLFVEGNLLW